MINSQIIRFGCILICGFIIDFAICYFLIILLKVNIGLSVLSGFLIASLFNYGANGKFVFSGSNLSQYNVLKYIILMALIISLRIVLIDFFMETIFKNLIYLSIIISNSITFVINFLISNVYIFKKIKNNE